MGRSVMSFPDTETTGNSVYTEQGWIFIPMSIPTLLVVDSPVAVEVRDAETIYTGSIGDLQVVGQPYRRTITAQVHQRLLDQSIQEYREIWRTLAEK